MNQEKKKEMEEVINSIFTSSFSTLFEEYYKQLYLSGDEKEQEVYTADIMDFMVQHKTDYRQDIVMLCGILTTIIRKGRKTIPELRLDNENKDRNNSR